MAYLLDTNILSELMRPLPNPKVDEWLDSKLPAHLFISSITVAEILTGIAKLPESKRKQQFLEVASLMLEHDFKDSILAFDYECAVIYADIVSQRTAQGRPIHHADAQIASICLNHNLILITRNTKDFEGINHLEQYNPF